MEEQIKKILKTDSALTDKIVRELISKYGDDEIIIHHDSSTYDLIDLILKHNNIKTILDPQCEIGLLLNKLPDYQSTGLNIKKDQLLVAQTLSPNSLFLEKDYLTEPITEKYDAVVTTIVFTKLIKDVHLKIIKMLEDGVAPGGLLLLVLPKKFLTIWQFENTRDIILKNWNLTNIIDLPKALNLDLEFPMSLLVIRKESPQGIVQFFDLRKDPPKEMFSSKASRNSSFWIERKQLKSRWDRNFHNPEYLEFEHQLIKKGTTTIGALAESVLKGLYISTNDQAQNGNVRVATSENIIDGEFTKTTQGLYYKDDLDKPRNFESCIIKPGDILFSTIGERYKVCIAPQEISQFVADDSLFIIRAKDNYFINSFLKSNTGSDIFFKQVKRRSTGALYQDITLANIKEILIPNYNFKDLNALAETHKFTDNLSESDLAKVLITELQNLGWVVNSEERIDKLIYDITLRSGNDIISFVEIKRRSRNEYAHVSESLKNRLDLMMLNSKTSLCYCFFNDQILKYSNGYFSSINDFPKPPSIENKAETLGTVSELISPYGLPTKNEEKSNITELTESPSNISFTFLVELMSDFTKKIDLLQNEVKIIRATTERTEETVKEILQTVNQLKLSFEKIKNGPSGLEDKLHMLNEELDEKLEILKVGNKDQLKKYESLLKKWFAIEWDKLEELSRSYLPAAEFLLEQLSQIENTDLSPFIIQYCRALENELLQKIFRSYVQSVIDRNINIDIQFAWDVTDNENGKPNNDNTRRLVKDLKKYVKSDPIYWFYELGTMEVNLRYLTGSSIHKSPLLQDIKAFILKYFSENVFDKTFLDNLLKIKTEYRNKAAHPNKISLDSAKNGQKEIREMLRTFLEYYR